MAQTLVTCWICKVAQCKLSQIGQRLLSCQKEIQSVAHRECWRITPTSWGGFNDLVVQEASARYGDQYTMIKADHISICKLSEKTYNSFQHLINFITMVQQEMLRLEDEHQATSGTRRSFSTHFHKDNRYVPFKITD